MHAPIFTCPAASVAQRHIVQECQSRENPYSGPEVGSSPRRRVCQLYVPIPPNRCGFRRRVEEKAVESRRYCVSKNKQFLSFIKASLMRCYFGPKPNVARTEIYKTCFGYDTARLFDIVMFAPYPKAARCERSEDD